MRYRDPKKESDLFRMIEHQQSVRKAAKAAFVSPPALKSRFSEVPLNRLGAHWTRGFAFCLANGIAAGHLGRPVSQCQSPFYDGKI